MSEGTDMFQKIHECQRDTETNLKVSQVAKPRAMEQQTKVVLYIPQSVSECGST